MARPEHQNQVQMYFGGMLALLLLLLYSSILIYMIVEVANCPDRAQSCEAGITKGMTYVVTMIGGLISALVIAELAVTPTGEQPVAHRFVEPEVDPQAPKKMHITKGAISKLTYTYLGVWALLGMAALVVGVVLFPDANATISDLGNTWLGLAVAAGYSYFGIQPGK